MLEGFRRNPVFYTLLLTLLGAGLAGLWYLSGMNRELKALKVTYDSKAAQYARYVAAQPSPSKSNLEALDRNYEELYEVYLDTMAALNLNTFDRKSYFGPTPQSRADWSFEIHKYIEEARHQALSNGVKLPPNTQFGISQYTRVGPPSEAMERVHAQVMIMSSLLQTLFDSGIESFVNIQRGVRPGTRAASSAAGRGAASYGDGDEFFLPASASAAVPNVLETYSFRLIFHGQSVALRSFVNRILNSPLPFAIRSVEVDLASESGSKAKLESLADNPFADPRKGAAGRAASVPIISENTSLFVVTLEFIDLVVDIEPAPRSVAPPASAAADAALENSGDA